MHGSAIPGGLGDEGVTNVVGRGGLGGTSEPVRDLLDPLTNDTGLTEEGYPVTNGSSFIMTVEYGPNGPEIRTILTYGQTGDQNSPLFTGRMTHGNSMIVDPWGKVVARMDKGEGIVVADFDPQLISDTRASLPALKHRIL